MQENNSILEYKVDLLTSNVNEMSEVIKQLGRSMERLVLAEERISHVVETNGRIQTELTELREEVKQLQISSATTNKTVSIVDKFIIAVAAAALIFMAAKTGLVAI